MDFSAILLTGVVGSGVVVLADKLWLAKRRQRALKAAGLDVSIDKETMPVLIDYAHAFFPVLLVVFLLRAFVVEPFRIPSGSMKPTLLVGDFILVNKFTYGIRLPVINKKIITYNEPERGDVMVFRYPVNPNDNFIKRVIGVPGDRITYRDKILSVNDSVVHKSLVDKETVINDDGQSVTVKHWLESLPGKTHAIYERLTPGLDAVGIVVPEGHYFMMGDNRDDSDDSRVWGFVPEDHIVGKAFGIWMSWDGIKDRLRFDRMGTGVE